jgi:signal transduction histidine kinase/ActR/RegA family two-component response regulator
MTGTSPKAISAEAPAVQQNGDLEMRLFFRASLAPSLIQLALVALASAFYISWWALAWFAVMGALVLSNNRHAKNLIPEGWVGTGLILVCSFIFVAPWASAWLTGGAEAGFFAGAMFGTQALTAVSMSASSRANFLAYLAPSVLVAVAAPFVLGNSTTVVLTTLLSVAQVCFFSFAVHANRNATVQEVLRIQREMEAAQKESLAKSQFLATMSHELRTPLNAVIGYAEILEEELAEDGRKHSAADAGRISRSARNLLTLINEILDFSKIEAGRMELHIGDVEIASLVAEVVETVRHITEANATSVTVEIAADAQHISTDAQRLRQSLLNLISNAAKFTNGGSIAIRADLEHDQCGAFLRIAVTDTGCGIAEDDKQRLFQPFTQLDGSVTRSKEGTGLGLVITKRLAELMGGDIAFVSMLGEGSTFTLRVRDHAGAHDAGGSEGPYVLVIEDEASARDLSRRMLAHLPLAMAEARTGAEGLGMARARVPNLIVLDIHLPDCKGWQVLEELKNDEALRDTPVLVVSADDDRARALRLGACDHLLKPIDKAKLSAAVLRYALADVQTPSAASASTNSVAAA